MNLIPVSTAAENVGNNADPRSHFFARHLWLPLLTTMVLSAVLMSGGGDRWLADLLYRAEGGRWLLKDYWLTAELIHRGGRFVSIAAAIALLLFGVLASSRPHWRQWSRPALYVVSAIALSTAAVALLKQFTGMDCPWDLTGYGGSRAYIGLFESRHGAAASGCFPAGHAGAGYAWVALYFAALASRPRWRRPALTIGLGAGLLFGITQQLRGAHFLSHDLWSLATCWSISLALYLGWLRRPTRLATVTGVRA